MTYRHIETMPARLSASPDIAQLRAVSCFPRQAAVPATPCYRECLFRGPEATDCGL